VTDSSRDTIVTLNIPEIAPNLIPKPIAPPITTTRRGRS
jgi:hypothetical protein